VSKLDPFKLVIDGILRADLDAPRKQRHTVRRIFDRLITEHAMVDVSYQVVRAYVAVRGPAGRGPPTGTSPSEVDDEQQSQPGQQDQMGTDPGERRRPDDEVVHAETDSAAPRLHATGGS
jgi:hypothetical protein